MNRKTVSFNELYPVQLTIVGNGNATRWDSVLRNSLKGIKAIGISHYQVTGLVGSPHWIELRMDANGADRITSISDTGKAGIILPVFQTDQSVGKGGNNGTLVRVFDKPVTSWDRITFELQDSTGVPLTFDTFLIQFVVYLVPNYSQNFPGAEVLDLQ